MSLESEDIQLREINAALLLTIKALEVRILELEEKLKMTSKNSSKPPSSDRFKPNLRAKKKKKRGGQQGHKGSNLPLSENPDEIEYLPADKNSRTSPSHFRPSQSPTPAT